MRLRHPDGGEIETIYCDTADLTLVIADPDGQLSMTSAGETFVKERPGDAPYGCPLPIETGRDIGNFVVCKICPKSTISPKI